MPITSPRATGTGYQGPQVLSGSEQARWQAQDSFNRAALIGKRNVNREISLTANSTTTTITDPRIGSSTVLHLTPISANAKAALTDIHQNYPNTTAEQAVLNHSSNAQTDRTFVVSFDG